MIAQSLVAHAEEQDPPREKGQSNYHFHRTFGHNTNQCTALKDEIEKLIRKGYLRQYVMGSPPGRGTRHDQKGLSNNNLRPLSSMAPLPQRAPAYTPPRPPPQAAPIAPPPPQGDRPPRGRDDEYLVEATRNPQVDPILTICGGSAAGGETMTARKRYVKAVHGSGDVTLAKRSKGATQVITFGEEDLEGVYLPHDDALVITALVANREVHMILVDNGSSTDIIFYDAFKKMGIPLTAVTPSIATVSGFSGEPVKHIGHWSTTLRVGSGDCTKEVCPSFCILDIPASYNMILRRSGLHALEAVVSTLHLTMKFPASGGIRVVRGNQKISQSCYLTFCKGNKNLEVLPADILDPRKHSILPKPEAQEEVVIN